MCSGELPDGASFNAVLLRTESNRDYFEDPSYYSAEMARWTGLVERAGGQVREVVDADGDDIPDRLQPPAGGTLAGGACSVRGGDNGFLLGGCLILLGAAIRRRSRRRAA